MLLIIAAHTVQGAKQDLLFVLLQILIFSGNSFFIATKKITFLTYVSPTSTDEVIRIAPLEAVALVSFISNPRAFIASISLVNPPLFFWQTIFIQSLVGPMLAT